MENISKTYSNFPVPKDAWDLLSLPEKSEMMKVAIKNGITNLQDIRDSYNEFSKGGYVPSKAIKDRISFYEGKAMTGAKDPITDKWGKNNSFENEAAKFYSVLPESIREQVLSNQDLADNLYSYSYNVGAGNFRKRVVPALERYYSGEGSIRDVENSMWASNDSKLRGLQRRRAEEKEGVRNALLGNMGAVSSTNQEPFEFIPSNPQAFFNPYLYQQTDIIPEPPVYKEEEVNPYSKEELEKQDRRQRLNALSMVLGMSNPYPTENNSMLNAIGLLTGSSYAKGGSIHIKPENRGKFTRLKKRTGHSASWFKAHGTPAQKKMATFALNAKKWKHGYGGNLFEDGGDTKEDITPWKALNNIEYTAIPDTSFTRDKTGLGSIEYFDSRYPEGITYPNGYHREHPLPGKDVILYNPNDNDEQDIRLDALHIMPKDATYDVLNTLYRNAALDSDVSYNAKAKYTEDAERYGKDNIDSYEQYFNNEADGLLRNMFIEGTPEYIESKRYYPNKSELRKWNTGLLPYIDAVQNYLVTGERPTNILPEVTVYGKKKKKALGGNLYNGTSQSTQQMDNGKVLVTNSYGDNYYIDPRQVNSTEWNLTTPEVSVTANPNDVARGRAERWFRDFGTESNDATSVAGGRRQNSHLDEWGIEGAAKAAAWAKEHPVLNNVGLGLSTIPLAVAAAPAVVGGGELAATALANPYVDAGLTSYFGAHGLNHAINEGINGWGDAAMTALEITPLGRLARPTLDAGKEGLRYTAKVVDNAARYASPSYDLYRTIGETTPRTTPTYRGVRLNGEQAYTGSPLFEFANIQRTSPSESYFFRAPNDIDILKLWNGRFRSKAQGNIVLPSGNVNGKFVSYGEPWQEFDFGEGSALYEFPVGPRRGSSRMATDWRGNKQDFSVNEAYEFMQQEKALSKELRELRNKGTINSEREEREIRKRLIQDKYALVGDTRFSSSINSANQTVIPNERWNFDWFLKTPFWKYSENPISGQVQKELMMRWPEAKPLETSTMEWADATRTPQITAENAASMTPEQWTAAQDAAIARGDIAEAQRLRDLHFKVSAPNTKVKEAVFNGSLSDKPFYEFNTNFRDAYWGGRNDYTTGAWFGTGDENTLLSFAGNNPNRLKKFYLNFSNPFIKDAGYRRWDKLLPFDMTEEDIAIEAAKLREKGFPEYVIEDWKNGLKTTTDNYALKLETTDYDSGIIKNVYENKAHPDSEYGVITDYIAAKPNQIKSADAVTYDDKGIRIPLGERDNFKLNDIRYGLLPFGIGLTGYGILGRDR